MELVSMESSRFDFLAYCKPGITLMTRDRREAKVVAIDLPNGIIRGVVAMVGDCRWRADGRYREAPAGAAGPLDLMPPPGDLGPDPRPRMSLAEALRDPTENPGCCD
jgi:hypothetical protein